MLQHMHVQPVFHNMFEVKARPREDWNLSIQVKPGKRSHPVTALTMLSLIPQLKITDCHQNSIGFSVPGKNWIFAFQMLFSLSYHRPFDRAFTKPHLNKVIVQRHLFNIMVYLSYGYEFLTVESKSSFYESISTGVKELCPMRLCQSGTVNYKFQWKKDAMFKKIIRAISRTTGPNIGLFALILMHFSCWI